MSQSSFPDIFKKGSTAPLTYRRQGGSFSLYLSVQSVEKYNPSRAGYAPGDHNYASLSSSRHRSSSVVLVQPKKSISRDEKGRDNIPMGFNEKVELQTGSSLKQRRGQSVFNISNFPYQTGRKFNNMTIDLEESESLKNKTEFYLNEVRVISDTFHSTKEMARETRSEIQAVVKEITQDLVRFHEQFGQNLRQFYGKLSKMRRETNEQLRGNGIEVDKIDVDLQTCSAFLRDMNSKGQKLFQQCLKVEQEQNISLVRTVSPSYLDFEQISSIPKSSRGETGDQSKRTKVVELLRKNEMQRKSTDWNMLLQKQGGLMFNGKEVDLLSFQDY